MMTRKDYVLLAETIRTRVNAIQQDPHNIRWTDAEKALMLHALSMFAKDLSANLQAQNHKFDRSVFMVAAGFPVEARAV